jgi:hypothetical protein
VQRGHHLHEDPHDDDREDDDPHDDDGAHDDDRTSADGHDGTASATSDDDAGDHDRTHHDRPDDHHDADDDDHADDDRRLNASLMRRSSGPAELLTCPTCVISRPGAEPATAASCS